MVFRLISSKTILPLESPSKIKDKTLFYWRRALKSVIFLVFILVTTDTASGKVVDFGRRPTETRYKVYYSKVMKSNKNIDN